MLYTHKLASAITQRLAFRATTRPEAEKWQRDLRAKLVELLGGFPATRSRWNRKRSRPANFPATSVRSSCSTAARTRAVVGYLLTPKTQKAAIMRPWSASPATAAASTISSASTTKASDRTNKDGYQHDFAIQAVEHGMAAVAIEPMAFGCRRDPFNKAKGLDKSACEPSAGAALLLGQTMIGWRVYDVMRTIDWIETRKELDSKRVGCMGISGGGTCTTFSAALEPRIKVAMISGYLNTFRDSIMSVPHCIDNYVPGILHWAEMYDVAGLIAPRPVFIESGEKDKIFPIAASRASFERLKKVYEVFGAGDAAEQETFDGPHSFWGRRGLPFLAKNLSV